MDSVRVGTVLLLTMFAAHVDASGGACSKESPSDVAALLQGALGVQRVTDSTELLPAKASREATHENEQVHQEEEDMRQEEDEQEEEQQEDEQQEMEEDSGEEESQSLSEEAEGDEQQETDGAQEEVGEDGQESHSLLEVDAQDVQDMDEQAASEQVVAQRSVPAGWFGEFSQGESSFTPSGLDSRKDNPEWIAKYGSNPSLKSPFENSETEKSEWFQESPSGGPGAAWQTNSPALAATAGKENLWRRTPTGLVQDYRSAGHGPRSASWFDSSVRQIDGFGREMQPEVSDPKRYVGIGWKKRAVSAPLTCKTPGCSAQASLQLFDASKEEAHLCTLSVGVHPTDYDDDYSREHIEFLKINAHVAVRECKPKGRGCNTSVATPLHPCLKDFNVDKLVDKNGKLVIEAKNSALVDECPYKGNLLSGVATASCMVRNRKLNPNFASKKPKSTTLVGKGVLKCVKPGCTAETMVHVSPAIAQKGGKCTMNMMLYQTDFDGAPEQIDFIQVGGQNATKAPVNPGKNPCNMAFKGKKPSEADRIFAALKNHDVTKLVAKSGAVRVKARISASVDECAYKGNLLYGDVIVKCVPSTTKPASKTAPAKALAKKVPAKAKKSGKKA